MLFFFNYDVISFLHFVSIYILRSASQLTPSLYLSLSLLKSEMECSDAKSGPTSIILRSQSPPPPPCVQAGVVVTPCAACKILRRRCAEKCVLAPYFPPSDPLKFTIAHRVFGASNIIKLLQVPPLSIVSSYLQLSVLGFEILNSDARKLILEP